MVLRGQIQGFVDKGISEIRVGQSDCNFEPGAAQPVVVGIVDVEQQVYGAAAQAQAGDVDLPQLDLGLCIGERVS